jgi:hypothetical protein
MSSCSTPNWLDRGKFFVETVGAVVAFVANAIVIWLQFHK